MIDLKEYAVIYNNKIGMGYILSEDISIEKFINPIEIEVGSEIIQPNAETTLSGYFNIKPAKYLGMIENEMIFYLGDENNLFEKRKFFLSLIRLSNTRIFSMFSHNAGRDYNLVNKKWK